MSQDMQLRLLVSPAAGREGAAGPPRQVIVAVPAAATVAEVAGALARHLGQPGGGKLVLARTGRSLAADARAADTDLRNGDHVLLGGTSKAAIRQPRSGVVLVVASGPDAGRTFPLVPGTTVVGRSRSATATVADDEVSRQHARVEVTGDGVTVEDLGSANGTRVNGVPVTGPTGVGAGDVIELGRSLLRVGAPEAPAATATATAGRVLFNRPPRVTPPRAPRRFTLSAPPAQAPKRRIPMASAMAPLLIGVAMAAIMRSPQYLAFAILSPVMAVWSYIEDRRGGRFDYEERRQAFERELKELAATLEAAAAAEAAERRAAHPDPAAALGLVEGPHPGLWARRPDDGDFLHARVGWGDRPSELDVEVATGGDPGLRTAADEVVGRFALVPAVPVAVDLRGVTGVCGPAGATASTARWLLTQVALHHSPRDVVIAAAVPDAEVEAWEWLTWLPHCTSEASPLSGPHLATDAGARALLDGVASLVAGRRAQAANRLGGGPGRFEPAVVVVLHGDLEVPRAEVTSILEEGPTVGVHVVWLGTTVQSLPGECTTIVGRVAEPASVTVTIPSTGERIAEVMPDELSLERATEAARAVAPVRDAGARAGAGQLPRQLSLPELLGLQAAAPEEVLARWERSQPGVDGLLGVAGSGPFAVDLRRDGPHALLGGTTGAGKSELLQTLVASMAATHRPDEVTFLLVDYKGGAAFKDCVRLPHTVGYVTDLDGHLVSRALVSLNAELRRREHLLAEVGAKDLLEMERKAPDRAPPSLVLIVDEFATLAKELPEFVDGVVNVAQRGRSLGIHLVLATQRPAGAINDNIRANTNLRMALRMNDDADSEDVIGAKDAAALPRSLPGRAYARTGASELTELQVAYAGGRSLAEAAGAAADGAREPVEVSDVHLGQPVEREAAARTEPDHDSRPTDLQLIVEAVVAAAEQAGVPAPVRPWVPPLPEHLTLADVPDGALGLVDEPHQQRRSPWSIDFDQVGSLLVYGAGGAGKTTFLRTLAVVAARQASPDRLHVYAIDSSRGLDSLRALPHVGSVVEAGDEEAVRGLLRMIRRDIDGRKATLGDFRAATLSELPDDHRPARKLVLIDGFAAFAAAMEDVDRGSLLEQLPQLIAEGRAAGIHFFITADRRTSIPMWLSAAVADALVLRLADPDDAQLLGLDRRIVGTMDLVAGRGYLPGSHEVQIATVSGDPASASQAEALDSLGPRLRAEHGASAAPAIPVLPPRIPAAGVAEAPAQPGRLCLGVAESDLGARYAERDKGHVLVAGGPGSGRSTALAALARSASLAMPASRRVLLSPRGGPWADAPWWSEVVPEPAAIDRWLGQRDSDDEPLLLFVDDADELFDRDAEDELADLVRAGRSGGPWLFVAVDSGAARRSYGEFMTQLRRDRQGVVLQPDPISDGDLLGVDLPRRVTSKFPPGRGYFSARTEPEIVQVVWPG